MNNRIVDTKNRESGKPFSEQEKLEASGVFGPHLFTHPHLWDDQRKAERALVSVAQNGPEQFASFAELLAKNHPNLRCPNLTSFEIPQNAIDMETRAKWAQDEHPLLQNLAWLTVSKQDFVNNIKAFAKVAEPLTAWESVKRNGQIDREALDVLWESLNPAKSSDFYIMKEILAHPLFVMGEEQEKKLDKEPLLFAASLNGAKSSRFVYRVRNWLEHQPANVVQMAKLPPKDSLRKAEAPVGLSVVPLRPRDDGLAVELSHAWNNKQVKPVKLDGKYSQGSKLIQANGKTYLLKGEPLKQTGEDGESTPAQREAAFPEMAVAMLERGDALAKSFIPAALLLAGNHVYAAMEWKGGEDICTLDQLYRHNHADSQKVMADKLATGDLHKIACIDYVLGNPDRHGNNIMTDGKDIWFIDHAGAFVDILDPTNGKTFVPFYLRVNVPPKVNFSELSQAQKLNAMSQPSLPSAGDDIRAFLWACPIEKVVEIGKGFGIGPQPIWRRFERVLNAVKGENPAIAINRLWVEQ